MKVKITKKTIVRYYDNIIKVGYCGLEPLLTFESPRFYTSGVNGWNADIYVIGNTAICTGYNPFGNIKVPFDVVENFNCKARELYNSRAENVREEMDKLLQEFIKLAITYK